MRLRMTLLAGALLLGGGTVVARVCPRMHDAGVAVAGARGAVRGAYDPAMAGCRYSCAAKVAVRERDLHGQPGVENGQLAKCPVSGVVFRADAGRPRVRLATGEYVTCCENCAAKLRKSPGRFINL